MDVASDLRLFVLPDLLKQVKKLERQESTEEEEIWARQGRTDPIISYNAATRNPVPLVSPTFEDGLTQERSLAIVRRKTFEEQQFIASAESSSRALEPSSVVLIRASSMAQKKSDLPLNRMKAISVPSNFERSHRARSRSQYSRLVDRSRVESPNRIESSLDRSRTRISVSHRRPSPKAARRRHNSLYRSGKLREASVDGQEIHNQSANLPQVNGLSVAQSGEQRAVPAFFLWPLREGDTLTDKHSTAQRDEANEAAAEPSESFQPVTTDDEVPEHLYNVLDDVEKILLRNRSDARYFIQHRHLIARLYESLEPLGPADLEDIDLANLLAPEEAAFEVFQKGKSYSWQDLLSRIQRSWLAIADQFCTESSVHVLITKLAASRFSFFKSIYSLCKPQQEWSSLSRQKKAEVKATTCYVFNASNIPDQKTASLPEPKVAFNDCSVCGHATGGLGHSFTSSQHAMAHLREEHFPYQTILDADLEAYVVPEHRIIDYYACASAIRVMIVILDNLTEVEKLILEIHQGVTVDGKFQNSKYRLTSSLVKTYQLFVRNVLFASHIAAIAKQKHDSRLQTMTWPNDLIPVEQISDIISYGYETEDALNEAKDDLVLMSKTGDYSKTLSYETVGAEYLLLVIVRDLCERIADRGQKDIITAYTNYAERLDYQVKRHPRRRLRNDIIHCGEEVATIREIFATQCHSLYALGRTLTPKSLDRYCYSNLYERRAQREIERTVSRQFNKEMDFRLRLCDNLLMKLQPLEAQLLRAIEVEQDDHGKAILVFTIVTVIFLPLSFVSSFLGMNTTDIRGIGSGQWIFWAVAVPLTVVTMSLAVILGYYGEAIRDMFWMSYTSVRGRTVPFLRSGRSSDPRKLAQRTNTNRWSKHASGSSSAREFTGVSGDRKISTLFGFRRHHATDLNDHLP